MLSPTSSCTAQVYTSLHSLLVRQLSRPAADQQLAHQVVKMNGASPVLFFFGWSIASELCNAPFADPQQISAGDAVGGSPLNTVTR